MPTVSCPGCGRQLAVTVVELASGITLECARCNTRVSVPGPAARAPAHPDPTSADDADDVDTTDPVSAGVGRAPATKPFLIALAAVLGLVLCLVAVIVAVQRDTETSKAAAHRSYPDNPSKVESGSSGAAVTLLLGLGCFGLSVVAILAPLVAITLILRYAASLGTGGEGLGHYRSYGADWRVMRGTEFECFLGQVFETLGYQVRMTKGSGDQGVDLIVTGKGRKIAVQAKGYANTVGNHSVMEASAGMIFYGCDSCVVVTNSRFSPLARKLAARIGCLLIDYTLIHDLIEGRIY